MKRLAVLVLLAACQGDPERISVPIAQSPPPPAEAPRARLRVTPVAPVVGAVAIEDEQTVEATRLTRDGEGLDIVESTHRKIERMNVEVSAVAPTKIGVTYHVAEATQIVGGSEPATIRSPLVGKSYLVWTDGGAIRATTSDGADVPPDQLGELQADHRELGLPSRRLELLMTREWVEDEVVVLTPEEVLALAAPGSAPGIEPVKATVTWTGTEAGIATFAFDVVMRHGDEASRGETALLVTLGLELATMRAVVLSARGKIRQEIAAGDFAGALAEGTVEAVSTYTYR